MESETVSLVNPSHSVTFALSDNDLPHQTVVINAESSKTEHPHRTSFAESVRFDKSIDELKDETHEEVKEENGSIVDTPEVAQAPEAPEKIEAELTKEEHRARLKKAIGIRFKDEKVLQMPTGVYNEISNEDSETAISTPTMYSADDLRESTDLLERLNHSDNLISETIGDDDSASFEECDSPNLLGDSVQMKTDFLNEFELPSISDISQDSEDWNYSAELSQKPSTITIADAGKFVDPLTGDSVSSPSSSSTSGTDSLFVLQEASQVSDTETYSFLSISDFNILLSRSDHQSLMRQQEEDNLIQFHKSAINYAPTSKSTTEFVELTDTHRIIISFLDDIIRNAVTEVEKNPENRIQTGMFDKEKLLNDLKAQYDDHCLAKDRNVYLNQKLIEYHRRNRIARAFTKLTPALAQIEYERYLSALNEFDYYLKMNEATNEKCRSYVREIFEQVEDALEACRCVERSLDSKIMTHVGARTENLQKVVKRELRIMGIYRDEISEARVNLITRQHTLSLIFNKTLKLSQISSDLTAKDFMDLQNQVFLMEEKIEERNVELKKMRQLHHTHMHMSQHFRERMEATHVKLKQLRKNLMAREEARRQLRKRLYEAKVERNKIKRLNQELNYQGGLLITPLLMHDYDITVKANKEKRATIKQMKETVNLLKQRIRGVQAGNQV